jgi:6-pyruvoyl-tetrahydropterin synthase
MGNIESTYIVVKGFSFESSHVTYTKEKGSYGLHGHSFSVEVRIEGTPDPDTSIIIDTTVIRELLAEIIRELDHKIVLGEKQRDLAKILEETGFNYTIIPFPQASMEALSQYIGTRLWNRLERENNIWSLETCVSQGFSEYACYSIKKE